MQESLEKKATEATFYDDFLPTSASQNKTLSRCARRWWIEKVAKAQQTHTNKQKVSFARGTVLHEAIERYLLDPELDAPNDYLAAKHLAELRLIKEDPELRVEHEFKLPLWGVVWRGFIDVWTSLGIDDHKTTKSIEKWGLTEEQLKEDIQCNIYAAVWFDENKDRHVCRVRHLQYQTTGDEPVDKVVVYRTRAEVRAFFKKRMKALAKKQIEMHSIKREQDVPQNKDACRDYGGCPFKDRCNKLDKRNNKEKDEMDWTTTEKKQNQGGPVVIGGTNPPKESQRLGPEHLVIAKGCVPSGPLFDSMLIHSEGDLLYEARETQGVMDEELLAAGGIPALVDYGRGFALAAKAVNKLLMASPRYKDKIVVICGAAESKLLETLEYTASCQLSVIRGSK